MKDFSEKTLPATSAQAIDSKQVIRQGCARRRVEHFICAGRPGSAQEGREIDEMPQGDWQQLSSEQPTYYQRVAMKSVVALF